MTDKAKNPVRLEFGNPDHILLAKEGYKLGEAIASGLETELDDETEECDQCNGTGTVDWYICQNCGRGGEDPGDIIYTPFEVQREGSGLDPQLEGRCRGCLAKVKGF